jgi:hypothetical protein
VRAYLIKSRTIKVLAGLGTSRFPLDANEVLLQGDRTEAAIEEEKTLIGIDVEKSRDVDVIWQSCR